MRRRCTAAAADKVHETAARKLADHVGHVFRRFVPQELKAGFTVHGRAREFAIAERILNEALWVNRTNQDSWYTEAARQEAARQEAARQEALTATLELAVEEGRLTTERADLILARAALGRAAFFSPP